MCTPWRKPPSKVPRRPGRTSGSRKVAETAPPEVIDAHPAWVRHHRDTAEVTEAGHEDLERADAVLFGTPPRSS